MTGAPDLGSTDLTQRLALLALVELSARGESPANALEVRDCCGDHVDGVATAVVGRPREVDVARALSDLAGTDLLEWETRDPSATGKGRPVYELAVDNDAVLEALDEDDRVAAVIEDVRGALD